MSSAKIKWLALILMIVDHIYYYIPNMPIIFAWIGRISFPLFLFIMVWGFYYTKSKKVYLTRLYIFSLFVNLIITLTERYVDINYNYGKSLNANIFRTYFTTCVFILFVELYKKNDKDFSKYLSLYICWQITTIVIFQNFCGDGVFNNLQFLNALGGTVAYVEGGLTFVLLGVIFYFSKDNKKLLAFNYIFFCFIYMNITLRNFVPRFTSIIRNKVDVIGELLRALFEYILGLSPRSTTGFSFESLLFNEYQWMMIFALPIILSYNNKKGKKYNKYIFYIFYPMHLCIIYLIGAMMS